MRARAGRSTVFGRGGIDAALQLLGMHHLRARARARKEEGGKGIWVILRVWKVNMGSEVGRAKRKCVLALFHLCELTLTVTRVARNLFRPANVVEVDGSTKM